VTEQEYRQNPAVNKSTLWVLWKKSPMHYKYALENPQEDTPALRFGRAFHMAVLQPEEFERNYVIAPDLDRRTKSGREEWQAFIDNLGDREQISRDDYDTIMGMLDAIHARKKAAALLEGCETETPLFWADERTGIECKCRLDAHKAGVVIDLKTCIDASTSAFKRNALALGYDVQAAHYIRGYKANYGITPEFYFIAVEKSKPYAINIIHASESFVDRGTYTLLELMDKLDKCMKNNYWGDYGETELILNEWEALPDDEC